MRTNNQSINRLLQNAEKALDSTHIVDNGRVKNGSIEGYISSFGANVINIDLLPTIAVYMQEPNHKKVIEAIAQTLYGNDMSKNNAERLFAFLKAQGGANRSIKEEIINASVALKIMIRTFEIIKKQ
jgi:hypothetical protein